MEFDNLFFLLFGVIAGLLIAMVAQGCGIKSAIKESHKADEEKEKNDPANWWKYGGTPPGMEAWDEEEGDMCA